MYAIVLPSMFNFRAHAYYMFFVALAFYGAAPLTLPGFEYTWHHWVAFIYGSIGCWMSVPQGYTTHPNPEDIFDEDKP